MKNTILTMSKCLLNGVQYVFEEKVFFSEQRYI